MFHNNKKRRERRERQQRVSSQQAECRYVWSRRLLRSMRHRIELLLVNYYKQHFALAIKCIKCHNILGVILSLHAIINFKLKISFSDLRTRTFLKILTFKKILQNN